MLYYTRPRSLARSLARSPLAGSLARSLACSLGRPSLAPRSLRALSLARPLAARREGARRALSPAQLVRPRAAPPGQLKLFRQPYVD